jgi:hypothetical protein
MKRNLAVITLLMFLVSCLLMSCSDPSNDANNAATDAGLTDTGPDTSGPTELQVSYDFDSGKQAWSADVTDYADGAGAGIGFVAQVRDLPEDVDASGKGFYVEGQNNQLETFMFIKRQLGPDDGLEPQTSYRLDYTVTLATNYPDDCSEEKGQKMYLKLGGSTWEPASRLSTDQTRYELNVGKGDGAVGGNAASAAGNLTHDEECALAFDSYRSMTRQHSHTASVETSADANLWLLVGVDTDYQGETSFYVDKIEVTVAPEAG